MSIVNERRVEEADSERGWVGCEVKLVFEHSNKEYLFERSFSHIRDELVREKLTYSTQSPRLSLSEYHELVYVDDISRFSSDSNESRGYIICENLNTIIRKNINRGYGLLLLNECLDILSSKYFDAALNQIRESSLNQTFILSRILPELPESITHQVISLGENIETITFKVEGFPFQPSHLLRDLDVMIYDRYVSEGDVFRREIYGHPYTIEAVEVRPNGARYQRDTSKIII